MEDVLVPQVRPVVAIDPRWCAPQLTQLRQKPLEKSLSLTIGRSFVDIHSGATCFESKTQMLSSRRLLLDGSQTPIANYKPKPFTFKPMTSVRAGSSHLGAPMFQIFARYYRGDGTTVRVVFKNVLSGVECELGFSGDWRMRDGCFWLDRGRKGTRELVSKIYCPEGVKRTSYHIDIAANMDAALIVMLCAVLTDKQSQDENYDVETKPSPLGTTI